MKPWALGLLALLACSGHPARQEPNAAPAEAQDAGIQRHHPRRLGTTIVPGPAIVDPANFFDVSKLCTGGNLSSGSPCTGWDAYLNALTPPYAAYFPPGYYQQSQTIALARGDTLRGDGMGKVIVETTSGFIGNAVNAVFPKNSSNFGDIRVEGITFTNANTSTNTFGIGFYQLDASYIYIDHCRFTGWFAGVALDQTEIAWVDHNDFELTSFTGPYQSSVTTRAVSQVGSAGSTTVIYEVMATHSGLNSIAAPVTTTTSNASPSSLNYNHITFDDFGAGYAYKIYRAAGGGLPRGLVCSVSSPTHACDDQGTLIDSSTGLLPPRGIWIVDGIDVTEGVTPGFSNALWLDDNTFNQGAGTYGVVDDGGDMHSVTHSQFNGGAVAVFAAGVQGFDLSGDYMEAQTSTVTQFDPSSLDLQQGVGGNSGINVTGNFISCGSIPSITHNADDGPWVITGNDFDCSVWPFSGAGIFTPAKVESNLTLATSPVSGFVGNPTAVVLSPSGHAYSPNASIGIGSKNSAWTVQLENGQSDSMAAMSAPEAGLTYTFVITQSASSASTLSWDSSYHWVSGSAPAISATLSSVSIVTCTNGGALYCRLAGQSGVTAGSYTYASLTVDAQGYITSVSNGAAAPSTIACSVSSHSFACAGDSNPLGDVFTVSLEAGQSDTLANPTGLTAGRSYQIEITQNASASTLAYGGNFAFPSGVAPTVTTTSAAVDIESCLYDGTKLRCAFMGDVH